MDGGTWYPQACATLGLKHRLHSTFEKSIVERAIEYVKKNRTECFDDFYYLSVYKERKVAIYYMFING